MIEHVRLPLSRADKILSAVFVLALLAACVGLHVYARYFLPDAARVAEVKSVTRDGRTVTMVECPKCEMCARIAPDAKTATVNVSRLKDGDPDAREFADRRDKVVRRVFAAMEEAASAKGVFWGEELADAWRTNGAPPRVVRRDADGEVLVRDLAAKRGTACELAVFCAADEPRTFDVDLAELGLAGTVEALDLTERAIPPDMEKRLSALVPAKGAKIYRLVSGRAAGKEK